MADDLVPHGGRDADIVGVRDTPRLREADFKGGRGGTLAAGRGAEAVNTAGAPSAVRVTRSHSPRVVGARSAVPN